MLKRTRCVRSDARDVQQVRRARSTSGKNVRKRWKSGRAECADARSAQTRGARRRLQRVRRRTSKFETQRGARSVGEFRSFLFEQTLRPRLSRGAPALGRQGHRAFPAASATRGKLEPRPRAQRRLRLAGRVLSSKTAFRAVRTSHQELKENRHKTTRVGRQLLSCFF